MNAHLLKIFKIYLLALLILTNNLGAYAQRPPTGGPNPPGPAEPFNFMPIIYVAGGIAMATATHLYIRNRGPKVAVNEHLPAYLLKRNILPTPDALHLMYKLNPRLNSMKVIRANHKLINPDFPQIPISLINTTGSAMQSITSMPPIVKEQVILFKSNLASFRSTKISVSPGNTTLDSKAITDILNGIENSIATYEKDEEESSMVKSQLMVDLFRALNKTLQGGISTKKLGVTETTLLKELSENFSDLLFPVIDYNQNNQKNSHIQFNDASGDSRTAFASADTEGPVQLKLYHKLNMNNVLSDTRAARNFPIKKNMLQGFAFAIYQLSGTGAPITKGPEVEGQYFIQYVLPALKSIPEAYHNLSPPLASYAAGILPPAKFFIIVKDAKGKQIPLQNALIDTKDAFKNPQSEKVNEMIIVPIFINK